MKWKWIGGALMVLGASYTLYLLYVGALADHTDDDDGTPAVTVPAPDSTPKDGTKDAPKGAPDDEAPNGDPKAPAARLARPERLLALPDRNG